MRPERTDATRLPGAIGLGVAAAGCALVGVGLWARREVARSLAREHVERGEDGPVATGAAARSFAELVRENTLASTGGRTYSEVEPYLGAEGPTGDRAAALLDERTGAPLENPDHDLWLQSTTLQTALMQAYVASRLAELTAGLGALFVAVGAGLAAAARAGRS